MASRYKYAEISYNEVGDYNKIQKDPEPIIDDMASMGYILKHVITLEQNLTGPTKIKLVFERDKY